MHRRKAAQFENCVTLGAPDTVPELRPEMCAHNMRAVERSDIASAASRAKQPAQFAERSISSPPLVRELMLIDGAIRMAAR